VRPILAIAATTLGEAIRRRVLLIILLIGVLFLAIAPGLEVLSARQETSVLFGITISVIKMTSAAIAIVLTVYLIPNEIERRTIYTILSKPVQRWQFLVGKYAGAVAALGLMMVLMTITSVVVFFIMQKDVMNQEMIQKLLQAPLMIFVQMSLLASVSIFFSTFASPIVNFFLSGGTYMVGSLFNSLLATLKENKDMNPALKTLAVLLHSAIPNFQDFDVQSPLANATQEIRGVGMHYTTLTIYAVLYITILLIGGILIFDRREV
jgi:ABC-type transport system involved in multi-copper enzyme maturation permease subunit